MMMHRDAMRTTVDLDDAILARVRALARQRGTPLGKEISRLLRKALESPPHPAEEEVAGFVPFAAGERVVTDDLIDRLRDQEGV